MSLVCNECNIDKDINSFYSKDKKCKDCRRLKNNGIVKCYIYVITNPVWPGWIKLGRTTNIKNRLGAYQTSSPFRDYEVYYLSYTEKVYEIERFFIDNYSSSNGNGEWYLMDKDEAVEIINKMI